MTPPEPEPVVTRNVLFSRYVGQSAQGYVPFGIYAITYTYNGQETVVMSDVESEVGSVGRRNWLLTDIPVGATIGGTYFTMNGDTRIYGSIANLTLQQDVVIYNNTTYTSVPVGLEVPSTDTVSNWGVFVTKQS